MPIPTIQVAAGVIVRNDGYFLLAQRPPDKAYPGYWEFPGGKIEAGESAYTAMTRELYEELGIRVTHATPWITRRHAYETACVELTFFRVDAWLGVPQAREGQTLAWQSAAALTVGPVLPANLAVLRALCLPPVLGITQAGNAPELFLDKLDSALLRGLKFIQLRETGLERKVEFAVALIRRAHAAEAQVVVNGDVSLAHSLNADGIHLTSAQLAATKKRPDFRLVGASCHSAEALDRAQQIDCDYALLSPVLPTASHPDATPLGWQRFAELCAGRSVPIYALGGLTADDLPIARQHGAHGIALLRGAWQ